MQKEPCPPAHLLERISNNPSVTDFVNSFAYVRRDVKRYLADAGLNLTDFDSILDFGCGIGRFFFTFQSEFGPHQRLHGCEVFEECAKWCQENIDFAEVLHTKIEPPLPYQEAQFDLVYALSVFTHLRLDLQFKWAWELHRVLRPGGVVFATVHGQLFIPLFYQVYLDAAKQRELYSVGEKGLFAYMSFLGESNEEGQVTVAAAQTLDFVREQFSAFAFLRVFPKSDLAGEQDLYIIRKPADARAIARPVSSLGANTERCSWVAKIATPSDSTPLSLCFNLDRQRKFRVYPRIQVPAICSLACQVDLKTEEGLLFSKLVPLNNQRLFGPSHYYAIEVDVPEYKGEIIADLVCRPSEPLTVLPQGLAEVEWNFPNFA